MSGGGQWADHVPRGCSSLIGISRRWGWARHLPGGWLTEGPWSTGGKWTQRRSAPAHAPIPIGLVRFENAQIKVMAFKATHVRVEVMKIGSWYLCDDDIFAK